MRQIDKADAVYFYNSLGYLGPSASFELGYCFAKGKAVYVAKPVQDAVLAMYAGRVATPAEVRDELHKIR